MSFGIMRLIHDGSCFIAILLNILLITFIFLKTPKHLRNYSIVLLNFSYIGLFTSSACLFVFHRIMSTDKYDLNAITGPCYLTESASLCFLVYVFMMHGHCHYCILLAFGFCYRFYVIKYSSPSNRGLLVTITIVYAPTVAIHIAYACTPLLESILLERVMAETYPEYEIEDRVIAEMMIGTEMSKAIVVAMMWIQGTIVPVYIIVIVTSILSHRILATTLIMSEESKRLHKEIIKSLIYQSLPPLLLIVASGVHAARDRQLIPKWEEVGHLPPTVGSLALAVSPICTLLFIKPYRKTIRSMFTKVSNSDVQPISSVISRNARS